MIELNYLEKDVEDILERNCEHYLGLKFMKRQLRLPVGIVDVFARHRRIKGVYYVIEIKKGIIDPSAYVQAVRYANWLNSEKSKGGKRIFIPIVIGDNLHYDLIKICEYFDDESHAWIGSIRKVFYRLFNFDIHRGLSFNFRSIAAEEHMESLEENYCHIDALEEKNSSLEYSIQRLLSTEEDDSPQITLVKSDGAA